MVITVCATTLLALGGLGWSSRSIAGDELQTVPPSDSAPDSRWFSENPEQKGPLHIVVQAMQPLDAPGNPYAGQYSAWDEWAAQNFRPGMDIMGVGKEFVYPYDPEPDDNGEVRQWMDFKVDTEGYMIPWSLWLESWTDKERRYGQSEGQLGPEVATGFAIGMVDAEVYAERQALIDQARAKSQLGMYPPLPAWIGEHPPLELIFVPSGDYVVRGPLGVDTSGLSKLEVVNMSNLERWYRYGPQGELLGQGEPGSTSYGSEDWISLFWPGLQAKIDEMDTAGYVPLFSSGTVSFRERPETGDGYDQVGFLWDPSQLGNQKQYEFIASYDYLGNEIDSKILYNKHGGLSGLTTVQRVPNELIASIYQAQLEAGLTGADTSSPFAGQPNGPQLATEAYESPRIAYLSSSAVEGLPSSILVRPLDDPQNPWQGQYSQWDILNYESFARSNVLTSQLSTGRLNETVEKIREAKAAGMSLDEFRKNNPQPLPGSSTLERQLAGIVDLSNYVSKDGWLVPKAVSSAWPHVVDREQHKVEWPADVADNLIYRLRCSAKLEAPQLQDYQQWEAELKAIQDAGRSDK
jgi:hypothetical protein